MGTWEFLTAINGVFFPFTGFVSWRGGLGGGGRERGNGKGERGRWRWEGMPWMKGKLCIAFFNLLLKRGLVRCGGGKETETNHQRKIKGGYCFNLKI